MLPALDKDETIAQLLEEQSAYLIAAEEGTVHEETTRLQWWSLQRQFPGWQGATWIVFTVLSSHRQLCGESFPRQQRRAAERASYIASCTPGSGHGINILQLPGVHCTRPYMCHNNIMSHVWPSTVLL